MPGTITISQTPNNYSPAYNPLRFVANTSTVIASQTNYSFIVDIYINGGGTRVARLPIPPDPTTDELSVDVSGIVQAYVTSTIYDVTNTASHVACPNNFCTYVVKLGERYDVLGVLTTYADLTTSSSYYAFNAALTRYNYLNFSISDYTTTTAGKKFLTNSPSTLYTSINDFGALYFYKPVGLPVYIARYKTYNSSGALLGTYTADMTGADNINYIAANPASINLVTLTTGVQPVVDSSVSYYTVQIYRGVVESETKTYYIREKCGYDIFSFAFFNVFGTFDKFNFYKRSDNVTRIERREIKIVPNGLDGAGNFVETMAQRQKIQSWTKTTETIKVFSDWIDEETAAWLFELVSSPELYLEENGELVSIGTITNTSYTTHKKINKKLYNLEVEFVLNDNYLQRG